VNHRAVEEGHSFILAELMLHVKLGRRRLQEVHADAWLLSSLPPLRAERRDELDGLDVVDLFVEQTVGVAVLPQDWPLLVDLVERGPIVLYLFCRDDELALDKRKDLKVATQGRLLDQLDDLRENEIPTCAMPR
jgi:hypothetical protein